MLIEYNVVATENDVFEFYIVSARCPHNHNIRCGVFANGERKNFNRVASQVIPVKTKTGDPLV